MAPTEPEGCWGAEKGWSGAPLNSARLVMRRPRPDDAAALIAILSDPDVARGGTGVPFPFEIGHAEVFVAGATAAMEQGKGFALVLEERASGRLVGGIGGSLRPGNSEIGFWIGREHRAQGIATEATRRCLRFIFRNLGVGLVWATTRLDNPASRRVLEKAGLNLHRREHETEIFVLDRESWEERAAAKPVVLVAAAALIDVDGRVLLTRRPEGKSMAGLWEFPGGKLREREAPEAALIRELSEELGIDTSTSCLAPLAFASHDYDDFHLLMPLFACRQWRGQARPREGQTLAWARPAAFGDYPMPPADLPLAAILRDWL